MRCVWSCRSGCEAWLTLAPEAHMCFWRAFPATLTKLCFFAFGFDNVILWVSSRENSIIMLCVRFAMLLWLAFCSEIMLALEEWLMTCRFSTTILKILTFCWWCSGLRILDVLGSTIKPMEISWKPLPAVSVFVAWLNTSVLVALLTYDLRCFGLEK